MVKGVDCAMQCANRSYNKYRQNKKGKYELSKLPGAAGPRGTCQNTRIMIGPDGKCKGFIHWDTLGTS
jgi:hypothetical protein